MRARGSVPPGHGRPGAWQPVPACFVLLSVLLSLSGHPGVLRAEEPPPAVTPYRIGSGDHLQLFVWREQELSRDLTVRTDGFITVPLVGDVRAAGSTPAEVAAAIEKRLAQYLNSPNVTVGVSAAQSAQFYVVGRVARPGAFPLDKPTRFLQALALAGGFVDFAKTDRVLLFRGGERPVAINYKRLESGEASDNVLLESGDTVVVP